MGLYHVVNRTGAISSDLRPQSRAAAVAQVASQLVMGNKIAASVGPRRRASVQTGAFGIKTYKQSRAEYVLSMQVVDLQSLVDPQTQNWRTREKK